MCFTEQTLRIARPCDGLLVTQCRKGLAIPLRGHQSLDGAPVLNGSSTTVNIHDL